jgi:hypothetical protein
MDETTKAKALELLNTLYAAVGEDSEMLLLKLQELIDEEDGE